VTDALDAFLNQKLVIHCEHIPLVADDQLADYLGPGALNAVIHVAHPNDRVPVFKRPELAEVTLFEYLDKGLGFSQFPVVFVFLQIGHTMHKLAVDLGPLLVPHRLALDVSLQVAIDEQHADTIKLEADILRSFGSQCALEPKWQGLCLYV
jgi:hypothetical protein